MFRSRETSRNDCYPIKIINGFHLIEMLITIVLVVILLTLALPMYSHYMEKAYRLAAVLNLQKIAAQLEDYYLQYETYPTASLHFSTVKHYSFRLQNLTDTDYLIQALPDNTDSCGILSLNAQGEKKSARGNREECFS